MASSKRERVLILVAALLFFIASFGSTALVLWQANQDKNDTSSLDAANDQPQDTCTIDSVAGGEATAEPEVFKPGKDVTELEKTDLEVGSGKEAVVGSCTQVKYLGTLADGTKFDGNFDAQTLLQFRVGLGNVIAGWDEGVVGMKEGGTRRLVIPSDKGYKEDGSCKRYDEAAAASQEQVPTCLEYSIPPNSDLVFVVKLVKITE